MKPINWITKLVPVADVKPTPKNYKIKNALGYERFLTSLKKFGRAGTLVCNADLTLIDGNSRLEEARQKKEKKIWVSVPDRKLTAAEFEEFSAIFDYAKAGDVDIERIEKELFTSLDHYKRWNMAPPMELLEGMGKGAKVNPKEFPKQKGKDVEEVDTCMVQLFFTFQQEKEFRDLEEKLMRKLRTANTTDTVLKTLRLYAKAIR